VFNFRAFLSKGTLSLQLKQQNCSNVQTASLQLQFFFLPDITSLNVCAWVLNLYYKCSFVWFIISL